MALRRLTMLGAAVAAGAAVVLMAPSAAFANTNPPLNPGQTSKDIVASDPSFNKQGQSDCDGITHSATEDAWVFVWPGGQGGAGDLVSVSIGFDNTGDSTPDATKTKSDGSLTSDSGTLKFVIVTPHGWRLETGASEITGQTGSGYFNLTHTCAGTETPPPTTTPPTTTPPTTTPPTTTTTTTTTSPPTCDVADQTCTTPVTTTTTPSLPTTGVALTGILLTAVAFIVGGAALMLARRRRDAVTPPPAE